MDAERPNDSDVVDLTTLPPELYDLVKELQSIQPGGSYLSEAKYYWEDACNQKGLDTREKRVQEATKNVRSFFKGVLQGGE